MAIHQQDDIRVLQCQAIRQADDGAVHFDLGRDRRLTILRGILRAALEMQLVLIGLAPACRILVVDIQHPVLAAHLHGIPAVAVLCQRGGPGAVTDTDTVDGLLTGALDQLESKPIPFAVHCHLFKGSRTLCPIVVNDGIGNTGFDSERIGVVCDGIFLLGGGGLIASLDPDRVLSGVQTGRIGIPDTRQRPSVQRYGLHGVLIAVLHHTGGKGQFTICNSCQLVQGFIV